MFGYVNKKICQIAIHLSDTLAYVRYVRKVRGLCPRCSRVCSRGWQQPKGQRPAPANSCTPGARWPKADSGSCSTRTLHMKNPMSTLCSPADLPSQLQSRASSEASRRYKPADVTSQLTWQREKSATWRANSNLRTTGGGTRSARGAEAAAGWPAMRSK